ncbi:unnamed protein product [Penicillium glandicola]
MSSTEPQDYYAILQVSRNSDLSAIKSSWRRLALARHPDKNPSQNAKAEFQLLHEAYSILADPEARQAYDAGCRASSTQHFTSQPNSTETQNDNGKKQSKKDLQSKLRQLTDELRDHECRLRDMRTTLMKLHTDIAALDNVLRSMEQDKASGSTVWNYLSSFLPGGAARIEQEAQERDRLYREKIATRRIKETEKTRRLEETRAYEALTGSFRRQIFSIESEVRREEQNEYQELAKKMAERMADEIKKRRWAQAQSQTQKSAKPAACQHKAWWNRVEGRFQCSSCTEETRRFAFKCPGCEKVACASCRDILRRRAR